MAKLQYAAVLVWPAAAALVAISHLACHAQGTGGAEAAANAAAVCRPSSCGDILNISKPFWLRGDFRYWDCGDYGYELKCVANRTILELPYSNRRFWVKAIWYEDMVIQVIDFRAIAAGPPFDLSPGADFFYHGYRVFKLTGSSAVELISCCMTTTSSRSRGAAAAAEAESGADNLYWLMEENWTRGHEWGPNDLPWGCRRVGTVQYRANCSEVRDAQMQVFNLTWNVDKNIYHLPCLRFCDDQPHTKYSSIRCFFCIYFVPWMTFRGPSYWEVHMRISYGYSLMWMALLLIVVRTSIGYVALLAFLVYKLWRRLFSMHDGVEMFLAEYRNCMPTRYTYRQIRKMTGNFKEKLGQGCWSKGSVVGLELMKCTT